MRSNGLRPALAALLLAPACAWAQPAPASAEPIDQDTARIATEAAQEIAPPQPGATLEAEAPAMVANGADPAPAETAPESGADAVPSEAGEAPAEPPSSDAQSIDGDALSAPTDAEGDFADIYGTRVDGSADTGAAPGAYDPWQNYNRRMHRFNNAVDRRVARPLARGYVKAVPRPVRTGVSNFFNNLGQPLTVVNSLLQGKGKQAGQAFGRFLLNTTFGLGGIFDPATRANLPHKREDFGQTMGVWGWRRSRYFELPFFGPRTVRDVFGMAGDAPLSPLRNMEADRIRIPLQGLQLVDVRAQLLATDPLREGAEDDYALVRDAWSQRRDYQIFGERPDGEELPDYLREEEDETIVPVDAMPVSVPVGG